MAESAIEVVQNRIGSIALHDRASSGSSLFFNKTSYLPHEIDWSYVNQEWQPSSYTNNQHDDLTDHQWPPSTSAASTSWAPVNNGAFRSNGIDSLDSSLFSSSLPSLTKTKLNISESDGGGDEEIFGSLEEIESQTIGNLLPDDEDDLLAGIGDIDVAIAPYGVEEFEEYDLFSSGGGLELEDSHEVFHPHVSAPGEHPFGEHPSRTLFVRNINSNVEDNELRELFELYGDIRTLYTACKHRGFVMISYFDIRAARTAMRALQGRVVRRRKLDIHYSIPKDNPSDKDMNQGTLVVFNLDASVSNEDLRRIFGAYGEVKEIRETPHKKHHKFIEFYDVRAAEAALRALNRSDIAGKRIKLEPSRPGGVRRSLIPQLGQEFDHEENYPSHIAWSNSPPADWGVVNETLDSEGMGYRPFSPKISCMQDVSSPVRIDNHMRNHFLEHQGHSLPEHNTGIYKNAQVFNSSTLGFSTVAAPLRPVEGFDVQRSLTRSTSTITESSTYAAHASLHRTASLSTSLTSQPMVWNGSAKPSSLMWQTLSPSHPYNQRTAESHSALYGSALSPHNHQYGSYSREHSLDRRHSYNADPSEASGFMRTTGSLEQQHHGPSSPNFGMFLPQRLFGNVGSPLDERRGRRMESNTPTAQMDTKKQFQLDLDRIISGEDTRTTLMIKNIPNKYTSKMLLAAIDEQHRGTYDFIYLPIDFKNKCNVGYAFINMLSPSLIVPFYQTFNGKKWEKFNSEKVASLAYARIQGKAALIAHFQNSSLMNEDKRCRPIIFHSNGPNAGDQEPFPLGENVRSRAVTRVASPMDGFYASDDYLHLGMDNVAVNPGGN